MKYIKFLLVLLLVPIIFIACEDEIANDSFSNQIKYDVRDLKNGHDYCGDVAENDLMAGPDIDIGSTIIANDEENLFVEVRTTGNWFLGTVKVWLGKFIEDLPLNNAGNPKRGKFTIDEDQPSYQQSITYEFSLADIGVQIGEQIIVAVHADVYFDDGEVIIEEGAWAFGEPIGGKAWGWYQVYTIQDCEDPPEWQCGDPIIDSRDGLVYATVKIGEFCWMAENLGAEKYTDGIDIQHSWYGEEYVNNPGNFSPDDLFKFDQNGDMVVDDSDRSIWVGQYGLLYPPSAIKRELNKTAIFYKGVIMELNQSVCPTGWYIPSDEIWEEEILDSYIDADIKSTFGWSSNGNNSTGLRALNSGYQFSEYLYLTGTLFFALDNINVAIAKSMEIPDNPFPGTPLNLNIVPDNYPEGLVRCIKVDAP